MSLNLYLSRFYPRFCGHTSQASGNLSDGSETQYIIHCFRRGHGSACAVSSVNNVPTGKAEGLYNISIAHNIDHL